MAFKVDLIPCDGNCFYRSVAKAALGDENRHRELRLQTMDTLITRKDEYIPFFGSERSFISSVRANRRDAVWNTDIADIAVCIIPQMLNITLHIYNTENDSKFIVGD